MHISNFFFIEIYMLKLMLLNFNMVIKSSFEFISWHECKNQVKLFLCKFIIISSSLGARKKLIIIFLNSDCNRIKNTRL